LPELPAAPAASLPGRAWVLMAAALSAGSVLALALPSALLDWQPERFGTEPWRAFSAAFVHWSLFHLLANLLGAAVVAALGLAARLPRAATLAWAAAWPLGHLPLLLQPALAHYGGLSGVLHAGVAVAALWLVVREQGRRRALGAAIGAGLVIKLVLEAPWGPPLRPAEGLLQGGFDIATAPLAHATGAAAGLLCAALALVLTRRQSRP
jgi:rhomboid family GlyGly-CTERM serine protease